MKIRCDCCNGPFGLIRHRELGYQFCSEACKNEWLAKRSKAIRDFKRWLYGSPVHDPGSTT
jgi:hypothetical protein